MRLSDKVHARVFDKYAQPFMPAPDVPVGLGIANQW
jgi:hypothetical protein